MSVGVVVIGIVFATTRSMEVENASTVRNLKRENVQSVSVLVVEDDPPSAKLLCVLLAAEGYDVELATSAEEALAILQTFRPRIVLLDLILPLMSGLLLAERLKSDPATRDMILVAVTAFSGHQTERVASEAGCVAYVRKPIDPEAFADLVARLHAST